MAAQCNIKPPARQSGQHNSCAEKVIKGCTYAVQLPLGALPPGHIKQLMGHTGLHMTLHCSRLPSQHVMLLPCCPSRLGQAVSFD
mmetsp:Transcript_37882/g.84436  ORF Transcript_37882/g.84436 Transcript_37882/m.84436 type:complete len:85 (-) Transcript_37882:173-427(-)